MSAGSHRRGPKLFHAQSLWMELTAEGVYSDPKERTRENFVGTYGTARDISERKEAEEVINFQAYHDLLTHLPNRVLLKDRLSLAIAHARRERPAREWCSELGSNQPTPGFNRMLSPD